MCRSGVPLPRAFAMLAPDLERGPLRDAVSGLADDLAAGAAFDQAYARHCDAFPAAYAALVAAGMRSGDLPGALAEIARHAERRARVARTLRRATTGPLVTAIFVLIVGLALVVFVGPRFVGLSEVTASLADLSSRSAAPTPSLASRPQIVIAGGVLAALAALVLATALFAWKRGPLDGRRGLGSVGLRWPIVGRIRLYAGLTALLSTLGSLLRRGVPLADALDLTAQATDEPELRRSALTMAAHAHDGSGLEDAARAAGLLPPSELWLLRAAQERGAPAEALEDLAAHYADRLDRAVGQASATIGPALEIAVGGVVFVLAYTFIVPITALATRVLGAF
jgi:type II secretory pathway component PulF